MPPLLERLRSALAPDYEVERELAAGGMGAVFVARDVTLERHVAIKILRPELGTAHAVERFLREGRTLASLRHPHIVPVHRAGEADGLFYYVMDLLEGETLAHRLERGPLQPHEVRQLAADLLDGLSHAHANGIVHRDVKPANIFFHDGRAVLVDFGLAMTAAPADARTRPGVAPGSPAYMAPEQVRGDASERSDIYAAGIVLFESLTGCRWADADPSDDAHWRAVPRTFTAPLQRALAWAPERRWSSAREFREQLLRAPRQRTAARVAAAAGGGLAIAAAVAGLLWTYTTASDRTSVALAAPSDLALLPLEVLGNLDSMIGRDIPLLASLSLDGLPGFTVVPPRASFLAAGRVPARSDVDVGRELNARYITRGSVARVTDGYEVRILVLEPLTGEARPLISVRAREDDRAALADALARELVRSIHPSLADTYRLSSALSGDVRALREFLAGEHAAQRNAWHRAERHYVAAIAIDSTFALARWRLANARRWLPRWEHGMPVDLTAVYRDHGEQFGERDRMLLEAELTPFGAMRLEHLAQAARRFPRDAYTLLFYGDELFHRGPLFGEPLERAVAVLAEAAASDTTLAQVHEHLAWAYMLLGDREQARKAVDAFTRTAAPPEQGAVYAPAVFEYAFRERFEPAASEALRHRLAAADAASAAAWLPYAVRYGLAFGIPKAQLAVGSALASTSGISPATRAIGIEGQVHALLALGRAAEAFAKADSVAALRGSTDAFAEAASWRVLPAALGWNIASADELRRGREMLERLADASDASPAIAWALALDATRSGDSVRAAKWHARAEARLPEPSRDVFRSTLLSSQAAARGDLQSAISLSAPLPTFLPSSAPGSFARAARYVARADWLEAIGDLEGAEREWMWAENTDQLALAREGAAAGEVDRILGTYAAHRRGLLALRRGDTRLACRLLRTVVQHWARADEPLQPLLRDARAATMRDCPS